VSLSDDALHLHTLANGVRVAAMPARHLQTGGVSVFVRVGSAHESRALNGIGHVLEHMAFKGTHERDAHRVNLDAETLGAEVNAHTDKDHTAYHMRGLGEHAPRFVAMLADIVRHATFPADELAREREVLLQEVAEVEDDPVTVAYQLFDHACWAGITVWQGHTAMRISVSSWATTDLDVERSLEAMLRCARAAR